MITYDANQRLFTISTHSSVYAMQVLPSGELIHVGFRPNANDSAANWPPAANLDAYTISPFVIDISGRLYELPAAGDVHHHAVALRVSFPQPARPPEPHEAAHAPVRDIRLRYQSHTISRDEAPALAPAHGVPPRVSEPREVLCIRLRDDAYPFEVTLFYRVTPEHDVIERWLELSNGCPYPVEVERCDFGALTLPSGNYDLLHPAGLWGREFQIVRRNLQPGRSVIENSTITTGHFTNPFVYLVRPGHSDETCGLVYFAALAYSGNWHIDVDMRQTGVVQVFGGYHPEDGGFTLDPGATHRTPAFLFGCTGAGLSGASQRLHGLALDYVLPRPAVDEWRPVLYNSWEATYFDVTEENQIALAREAAALGVELFVMDDGWFGARRHDRAGLGDWYVRSDAFPNGLKPLIDEVHRLGMRFGLWVEPEMVNPDSDLYRAHPDWILHYPGRPRTLGRNQMILDFGRPEVVAYIEGLLTDLLENNAIDFIKWDMNRYATEPGSPAGRMIWRRHVEGVYGLMDTLRRLHPQLTIESCSGGAGRVDFGILARVDQFWASDNTDAYHRIAIQNGFSYAYPPRAMMDWVTHERSHQTGLISPLSLRFDVAMRGALGIGSSLNALSSEEKQEYARYIAFYKRIRPVVQGGRLFRLEDPAEAGFSIWQFVAPDSRQSVVSAAEFHQVFGWNHAPVRLYGLQPAALYRVTGYTDEDLGTYPGWQLMTLGLPLKFDAARPRHNRSATWLLEAVV